MNVFSVLWAVCLVRLCSAGFWCCCGGGTTDDSTVLDIANPDESKVKVYKDSKNGVEHTTYHLKSSSKITSVVDGDRELWKSSGKEKFVSAKLSSRGDSSVLLIHAHVGCKDKMDYFEKSADGWVSIDKEEYKSKLNEMRKSLLQSPNPTTPS